MIFRTAERNAAFESVCASLVNKLCNLGRTDKAHGLDTFMVADALYDFAAAVDDVENTVRQASFFQKLRHSLACERHELARLHYHRVAENERVWQSPVRHHQREIERHDRRDNAERKMVRPAL